MTTKELLSLAMSIVAVTLSVIGSYFTLVRQTDDVRVIIQAPPIAQVTNNRIELSTFAMTLINAGNRAVIIHSVWLQLDQGTEGAETTGCRNGQLIGIEQREVILKEKEISSRILQLDPIKGLSDGDTFGVALAPENEKRGYFPLELCVGFQFSTPSQALVEKMVTLYRFGRYDPAVGFMGPHTAAPKSFTLVKQFGTIFGE